MEPGSADYWHKLYEETLADFASMVRRTAEETEAVKRERDALAAKLNAVESYFRERGVILPLESRESDGGRKGGE